ncbi:hypothetical protein DFP72DRAFT_856824 [Ephemerocybe angulata]|uniref:Uncharacterized protein n=1 Tax=Ephemerocybe angulata TaxID=980116 RepID=A0A8H6HF57_9AGAR|nr:hypothetical protein DFP72DRAFT_856824 [Tulosesus angulatus]
MERKSGRQFVGHGLFGNYILAYEGKSHWAAAPTLVDLSAPCDLVNSEQTLVYPAQAFPSLSTLKFLKIDFNMKRTLQKRKAINLFVKFCDVMKKRGMRELSKADRQALKTATRRKLRVKWDGREKIVSGTAQLRYYPQYLVESSDDDTEASRGESGRSEEDEDEEDEDDDEEDEKDDDEVNEKDDDEDNEENDDEDNGDEDNDDDDDSSDEDDSDH